VLDRPYAAARESPFGPYAYAASPQEVEMRFGAALAAQPSRPTQFTLHFITGEDEFTTESKQILEDVFTEIAKRPTPDIDVGELSARELHGITVPSSLRQTAGGGDYTRPTPTFAGTRSAALEDVVRLQFASVTGS
jgi:hypothetical protein